MENLQPLPSHIEWVTFDDIRHDALRGAAAYWEKLRGERKWPSREELKFREIAPFLPYLSLVRVIDGGADFEHRFVGEIMVRGFAVPVQNRRFSEIAFEVPDMIEASYTLFRKVLETGAPAAIRWLAGHDEQAVVFTQAERILLPFGATEDRADHIAVFGFNETRADKRPALVH